MPDVKIRNGGAPTDSLILVNTDGETIVGDGSIDFPLRATGSGTARQVFLYQALGTEGTSFTVNLPNEQLGNYGVIVQGQGLARFLNFDVTDKTETSFTCDASNILTEGDEILFVVEALTA